jgi:hypothetical protein
MKIEVISILHFDEQENKDLFEEYSATSILLSGIQEEYAEQITSLEDHIRKIKRGARFKLTIEQIECEDHPLNA